MKEEKYINQLFKVAKEETPKQSYEEVAQRFENSLMPLTLLGSTKAFLAKFINLNFLLMITTASTILLALFWTFMPIVETTNSSIMNPSNPIISQNQPVVEQKEAVIPEVKEEVTSLKSEEPTNTIPAKKLIESKGKVKEEELIKGNKKKTTKTAISNLAKSKEVIKESKENIAIPKEENNFTLGKKDTSKDNVNLIEIASKEDIPNTNSIAYATENNPNAAKEVILNKEVVFLLSKTDTKKNTNIFVEMIRAYGIESVLSVNKRKKGEINKMTLRLEHAKGLDWRMKLQGFEQLEIKLLLDEHQNPYGITYRLNQNGDFAEYLTLAHKGRSLHKFAEKGIKSKHQHTKKLIEH